MTVQGTSKLRASARRALGASLRKSAPRELIAHIKAGDHTGASFLVGRVTWPLEAWLWNDALKTGRAARSVTSSKWPILLDGCQTLVARDARTIGSLGMKLPCRQSGTRLGFCAQVASNRADFASLAASLLPSSYRQLKLAGQSQKEDRKAALKNVPMLPFK
eukprot:159713-Amphidinium_carterae.1